MPRIAAAAAAATAALDRPTKRDRFFMTSPPKILDLHASHGFDGDMPIAARVVPHSNTDVN
jgi:hypothetical protein